MIKFNKDKVLLSNKKYLFQCIAYPKKIEVCGRQIRIKEMLAEDIYSPTDWEKASYKTLIKSLSQPYYADFNAYTPEESFD